MASKITLASLDKIFEQFSGLLNFKMPPAGWIKTISQALGMNSTQLAKKLGVTQPRIVSMEKNEMNLKLSTMQKIADALGCEFVYAFIPKTSFKEIRYNQAKKKAKEILKEFNHNISIKGEKALNKALLDSISDDIFQAEKAKIWDED